MKKLILLCLLCLVTSLTLGSEQSTKDEALVHRTRMIANKLRCPTCQSMSVKDSEAGLSLNMKAMIREMLIQGKGEDEIIQFFVDRYGEWILREPPKTGFNLLLWTLPGVFLALAFIGVIWNAKAKAPKPNLEVRSLSAAEQAEIDQDLKHFNQD